MVRLFDHGVLIGSIRDAQMNSHPVFWHHENQIFTINGFGYHISIVKQSNMPWAQKIIILYNKHDYDPSVSPNG